MLGPSCHVYPSGPSSRETTMPIDLADLRELEHLIQERFARIEKGMNILKDMIQHNSDHGDLEIKWKHWKGQKLVWWNPRTQKHE